MVDGVFTATDYAVDGYLERVDYAHRNAAYGAAVMRRVLGVLKVGGVSAT